MDQLGMKQTWSSVPGIETNPGIDTIEFIFHKYKPKDIMATYVRSVCDIRPQTHCKSKSYRLSMSIQHARIVLNHNETTCQQRHLIHQI